MTRGGGLLAARLLAASVLYLVVSAAGPARAEPELRVLVASGVASAVVTGDSLVVAGRPWPGGSLRASASGGSVRFGKRSQAGTVVVRARGALVVNGKALPGSLRLVPRGGGALDVINLVELEPYVASAVASETPPSWPREALRAQAVVARSYALHERERRANEPYDLEASVISQRYAVGAVPEGARDAARATRGEVLYWSGQPILAAFHASSGGTTATAAEVWGEDIPYLASVSSPDDAAPDYFWSYEINVPDLASALRDAGYTPGRIDDVRVASRSASGRVLVLQVGALELSGRDLREVLGGRALRSSLFDARREGGLVRFLGSGAGHGVGLCQWGASALARQGRGYREILAHYYPGTRLRRLGAPGDSAGNWSATR